MPFREAARSIRGTQTLQPRPVLRHALGQCCGNLFLLLAISAALGAQTPDPGGSSTSSKPHPPCPVRQPQNPGPGDAAPTEQQPSPEPLACEPVIGPIINWYDRFLSGPEVKPMTPAEKARLAAHNVLEPFNALTILATSTISIGADSHSPYGPGMRGFGKDVGTSYTQDMTGEFFGTFLIPSLVHQDPHYHRMPHASVPRRIAHTVLQVVWSQGDNGRGMPNYANIIGFAIDDEIGNTYLPGRDTRPGPTATRYAAGFALAPADNLITEFLPDLARRIHVRDVFVRRIINQLAKSDPASQ